MAKPRFHVQHFVACLNAPWEGPPGPNTPRTLETVHYTYRVPPDTEFPFTFEEFWLYTRLFRTNQAEGERSSRSVWSGSTHPDGRAP